MNLELICISGEELLAAPRVTDLYAAVTRKNAGPKPREVGFESLSGGSFASGSVEGGWQSLFMGQRRGFLSQKDVVDSFGEAVLACGPWKPIQGNVFWTHYSFQEYCAAEYVAQIHREHPSEFDPMMEALQAVCAAGLELSRRFLVFVCGLAGGPGLHRDTGLWDKVLPLVKLEQAL